MPENYQIPMGLAHYRLYSSIVLQIFVMNYSYDGIIKLFIIYEEH